MQIAQGVGQFRLAQVGEALKEQLRRDLKKALPDVTVSFEAADIISQVMSFGSPTPIEVAVQGPSLAVSRPFAQKVYAELSKVPSLRDFCRVPALFQIFPRRRG